MSSQLKIKPAIQWYEGMMLAPHHFQQKELREYQQSLIKFRLTTPFAYGFLSVSIDEVLLSKGTFVISNVSAVFPDGEIVSFDEPLQISLSEYKTNRLSDLTVWIAMQSWDPDLSPLNKDAPRYRVLDGDNVSSNEDITNVLPISRLVPIISLYIAHDPNPKLVSMPIAKVKCFESVFSLDTYIRPCFTIEDAGDILDSIKQSVLICRKKESLLLQKLEIVFGTPQETWIVFVLNTLRQSIPLLEMISQNPHMHPYEVYKVMCQVVGVLAMLKHLDAVVDIPAYEHHYLHRLFSILLEDIKSDIESIAANYHLIPFEFLENVFSLMINTAQKTILIAITFKEEQEEQIEWVNNTIIVSDSEFDAAVKERIVGARRRILKAVDYPSDLYEAGDLLIEIEIDDRYVFNKKKLILFNPISDSAPENIAWCIKE